MELGVNMSKERELLERALQLIDDAYEGKIALSLCNEIKELLARPEPEPIYIVGKGWQCDVTLPEEGKKLYKSPPKPEPVAWQVRSRPDWAMEWGEWMFCTEASYEDFKKHPVLHDWWYDVRELYAEPPHYIHKKNPTGE